MNKKITVVLLLLAAGCVSSPQDPYGGTATNPAVGEGSVPPLDPSRRISEQDCSRAIDNTDVGNLKCRELTAAQRRAMIAEEERLARERREAAERAARERQAALEAEQRRKAEEEAARKRAEEERLAAERRRAEEEAARKAREERERQEARLRAEQEAREAAERECRRLEQARNDGRAHLEYFVATWGNVGEFKGIAGQISAFLAKASKPKPCP